MVGSRTPSGVDLVALAATQTLKRSASTVAVKKWSGEASRRFATFVMATTAAAATAQRKTLRRYLQLLMVSLPYNAHIIAVLATFIPFLLLKLGIRNRQKYSARTMFRDWGTWFSTNFLVSVLSTMIIRFSTRKHGLKPIHYALLTGAWFAPVPWLHWLRISGRPSFLVATALTTVYYLYSLTFLNNPENSGRRESNLLRNSPAWKFYEEYFNLKIVNTTGQKLKPDQARVMGYHPHGMAPGNVVAAWQSPAFKAQYPGVEVRALTDTTTHLVPGMRDGLQYLGVREASASNYKVMLTEGNSLAVVPGGQAEMFHAKVGKDIVLVTKHKGFVRMALKYGASLVPCLSLGEHEIFDQMRGGMIGKVQDFMYKNTGVPFPWLPQDKIGSPVTLIPERRNMVLLVGPELRFDIAGEEPTEEEVDAAHAEYFATIRRMFDEHAAKNGYSDYSLVYAEEREAEAAAEKAAKLALKGPAEAKLPCKDSSAADARSRL